jgi:hypothetical protein
MLPTCMYTHVCVCARTHTRAYISFPGMNKITLSTLPYHMYISWNETLNSIFFVELKKCQLPQKMLQEKSEISCIHLQV